MGHRFEMLVVEPLAGYESEIGVLLWMLESGRRRLKEGLAQMDATQEQALLDWRPRPEVNSIGSHLYHIAIVETDWLFMEVLADYTPPTAVAWPDALLPHEMRDEQGLLTHVPGETLANHLQRLDAVRQLLLDAFRGMSLNEFRRPLHLEQYDVTLQWVLHHLIQHEAQHRGQILDRRAEAERILLK
jgi:uncharacterized damage-inducible protein DinB